jgi:hypothetical protein
VIPLTAAAWGLAYTRRMEWMLQVVDEIDDVISAVRLCSMGWAAEIGLMAAGIAFWYRPVAERRDSPTPL